MRRSIHQPRVSLPNSACLRTHPGSNGPFMEQLPMHPVRRISHHAVEIQQKDYEYEKPSSAPIEPETIDSTTLPVRSRTGS